VQTSSIKFYRNPLSGLRDTTCAPRQTRSPPLWVHHVYILQRTPCLPRWVTLGDSSCAWTRACGHQTTNGPTWM